MIWVIFHILWFTYGITRGKFYWWNLVVSPEACRTSAWASRRLRKTPCHLSWHPKRWASWANHPGEQATKNAKKCPKMVHLNMSVLKNMFEYWLLAQLLGWKSMTNVVLAFPDMAASHVSWTKVAYVFVSSSASNTPAVTCLHWK